MDPAPYVPLGRIVKTHGLAGEVSVIATDGLPLHLLVGVTVWFVPPPGLIRQAVITGVRPGPKGPLLRFDAVKSPEAAAALLRTSRITWCHRRMSRTPWDCGSTMRSAGT
jgi:ribosomal 30S subunit maturation factor RimM